MKKYAGIEAGGSKMVCAISDENLSILDEVVIPTETPETTMPAMIEFFQKHHDESPIDAIGIASFGPLNLDKSKPNYGSIASTPKLPWRDFDFVGAMKAALDVPIGFDTDVNAAALGEHRLGAAQGCNDFIYITVGTGIGAGAMIDGKILHGATHPEMGHMLIPHNLELDPFEGVCPYHKDCLEGLASGPSMKERWKVKSALDLPQDHIAWKIEAEHLSAGIVNMILNLSPKKIVMGGGVMKQMHLFNKIRKRVPELINGYVKHPLIDETIEEFIVPAGLSQRAGTFGALALAELALSQ